MTLDPKKNKNIKQTKPIIKTTTQPNTKLTKDKLRALKKINRKWICTNS